MHRQMPHPFPRLTPVLFHLGNVAVGVTAFISPAQTVEARVAALVYLWAGMFAAGGIVGAYGAWRRQWITERSALYPEITAWAVYALSVIARFATDGGISLLFVGLAFLLIVAALVMRHQQLTSISRTAAEWERRE